MKYKIKKGKHGSGLHFAPAYVNDIFNFSFCLNQPSSIEPTGSDDSDVSKLHGFSHGYHHHNSIRLGWTHNYTDQTKYSVHLYYYNTANPNYKGTYSKNGAVMIELASVEYGKTYFCNISLGEIEILDSKLKSLKKQKFEYIAPKFKLGYRLYPYYGGNMVAPVEFNFEIKH